jgi:hypothetical protein
VKKEKHVTEEERFAAYADSVDTSGLVDALVAEDAAEADKKRRRSTLLTDEELDALPCYTKEELAGLPKPWTVRGEMIDEDGFVIKSLADKDCRAARIFVTGEVDEDYIGDVAVRFLINANDVYYKNKAGCEPLFIETRNGTAVPLG